MKEIRIPLGQFDLEGFLTSTIEFLSEWFPSEVDPNYGIVWVQDIGDVPVFGAESGWDVLCALKEERKTVFFPFAYSDDDGTLICADWITYLRPLTEENYDGRILVGWEDLIGFVVQITDGTVIINSAIYAGGACPGPEQRVDFYPNHGLLEEA